MQPVTLRTVKDAKAAAQNIGLPDTMLAARAWLAGCPRRRDAYDCDDAHALAQQAAGPFRVLGRIGGAGRVS